nr:HaeIII family restriction endonuclease [uncultured Mucilaginibacter sp.]
MAKNQTDTGKALEYCFATAYYEYLSGLGLNVILKEDIHYLKTKSSYNTFSAAEQASYFHAAKSTIATMVKIEPGLANETDMFDPLEISVAADAAGITGDVRDVLFKRRKWQIGFSVKNNHDASKHSRLSATINFPKDWFGYDWSDEYQAEVGAVFSAIKAAGKNMKWDEYPEKETSVYVPVLLAFKKELDRLNANPGNEIPRKLLSYLLGRDSFYKVIKRDALKLVVVKGYNMNKDLGRPYNSVASVCGIPAISYPTRIIEFSLLDSNTTLFMTLDKGWQISFRIHSASTRLEESLKFDINLIGNPPSLFTHYVF